MERFYNGAYLFQGRLPMNFGISFGQPPSYLKSILSYIPIAEYPAVKLSDVYLAIKDMDTNADIIIDLKAANISKTSNSHLLDQLYMSVRLKTMNSYSDILLGIMMGSGKTRMFQSHQLDGIVSSNLVQKPKYYEYMGLNMIGKLEKVYEGLHLEGLLNPAIALRFGLDGMLLQPMLEGLDRVIQIPALLMNGIDSAFKIIMHSDATTFDDPMTLVFRPTALTSHVLDGILSSTWIKDRHAWMNDDIKLGTLIRQKVWPAILLTLIELGLLPITNAAALKIDVTLANRLIDHDAIRMDDLILLLNKAPHDSAEMVDSLLFFDRIFDKHPSYLQDYRMRYGNKNKQSAVLDLLEYLLVSRSSDTAGNSMIMRDFKLGDKMHQKGHLIDLEVYGNKVLKPSVSDIDFGMIWGSDKVRHDAILMIDTLLKGMKVSHESMLIYPDAVFGSSLSRDAWLILDGIWLTSSTVVKLGYLMPEGFLISNSKAKKIALLLDEIILVGKQIKDAEEFNLELYGIKIVKPAMIQMLEMFGMKIGKTALLDMPLLDGDLTQYVWWEAPGVPFDPLIVPSDRGSVGPNNSDKFTDAEGEPFDLSKMIDDYRLVDDPRMYPTGDWRTGDIPHGLGGPSDPGVTNEKGQYLAKIAPTHFHNLAAFMIVVWDNRMITYAGYNAKQGFDEMLDILKAWIQKYGNNDNMYWRIYRMFKWYATAILYNPYAQVYLKRQFDSYAVIDEGVDGYDPKNGWRYPFDAFAHRAGHDFWNHWTGYDVIGGQWTPAEFDMFRGKGAVTGNVSIAGPVPIGNSNYQMLAGTVESMKLTIKAHKAHNTFGFYYCLQGPNMGASKLEVFHNGQLLFTHVGITPASAPDVYGTYENAGFTWKEFPIGWGDHEFEFRYTQGANSTTWQGFTGNADVDWMGITKVTVTNYKFINAWSQTVIDDGSANSAIERWLTMTAKYWTDHYYSKIKGKRMIWLDEIGGTWQDESNE